MIILLMGFDNLRGCLFSFFSFKFDCISDILCFSGGADLNCKKKNVVTKKMPKVGRLASDSPLTPKGILTMDGWMLIKVITFQKLSLKFSHSRNNNVENTFS